MGSEEPTCLSWVSCMDMAKLSRTEGFYQLLEVFPTVLGDVVQTGLLLGCKEQDTSIQGLALVFVCSNKLPFCTCGFSSSLKWIWAISGEPAVI